MKKLFHVLFRLIFGLTLIGLGVRTLTEMNRIEPFVSQTMDQIQHKILKKDFNISFLKAHTQNIVFAEAFLFMASGFLTIFGFGFAKFFAFLAIFVELSLVHNVYFYREPKHLIMASAFLGILGGVFNI